MKTESCTHCAHGPVCRVAPRWKNIASVAQRQLCLPLPPTAGDDYDGLRRDIENMIQAAVANVLAQHCSLYEERGLTS